MVNEPLELVVVADGDDIAFDGLDHGGPVALVLWGRGNPEGRADDMIFVGKLVVGSEVEQADEVGARARCVNVVNLEDDVEEAPIDKPALSRLFLGGLRRDGRRGQSADRQQKLEALVPQGCLCTILHLTFTLLGSLV